MRNLIVFAVLTMLPLAAQANISVRFIESAPKDSFVFTNQANCDLGPVDIVLDLSTTQGKLIFDTTAAGGNAELLASAG